MFPFMTPFRASKTYMDEGSILDTAARIVANNPDLSIEDALDKAEKLLAAWHKRCHERAEKESTARKARESEFVAIRNRLMKQRLRGTVDQIIELSGKRKRARKPKNKRGYTRAIDELCHTMIHHETKAIEEEVQQQVYGNEHEDELKSYICDRWEIIQIVRPDVDVEELK
jgi:hypothetical protein